MKNRDYISAKEEKQLEESLTVIGKLIEAEEKRPSVPNTRRENDVIHVYEIMKSLLVGESATITYALHKPFSGTGSVSVIGKNLVFSDAEPFMEAVRLADNLNVYPKTDGTVQLDFTFHSLTIITE